MAKPKPTPEIIPLRDIQKRNRRASKFMIDFLRDPEAYHVPAEYIMRLSVLILEGHLDEKIEAQQMNLIKTSEGDQF